MGNKESQTHRAGAAWRSVSPAHWTTLKLFTLLRCGESSWSQRGCPAYSRVGKFTRRTWTKLFLHSSSLSLVCAKMILRMISGSRGFRLNWLLETQGSSSSLKRVEHLGVRENQTRSVWKNFSVNKLDLLTVCRAAVTGQLQISAQFKVTWGSMRGWNHTDLHKQNSVCSLKQTLAQTADRPGSSKLYIFPQAFINNLHKVFLFSRLFCEEIMAFSL